MTNQELANLIFPNIVKTIDDLEKEFPKRNLPEGAEVMRFAPSPTGFLHTGSLFMAMIGRKVTKQSGGIFFIRLEDTDTKREIQGSGEQLLDQLKIFGIIPDEGYLGDHQKGGYGPYIQSQRADIYCTVIKHLIELGLAYPCFCSPSDLDAIRKTQEALKENPGYYGKYAKCRDLSNEERARRINAGEPYVIRYRSNGNHENKITVKDVVRGEFEIAENDQDVVILKSDGLPTYHFAHVVDDHFMRTTTVTRGEEWIASLPIHVDMFNALGWEAPKYAHTPVIMKLDDVGHKRKLSKRLDKEAAVSYFINDGYPVDALVMYLMTIANSNFEEYILNNKFENMDDFKFSFSKMSLDGALFDMGKLNFFAREIIGKKSKNQIADEVLAYSKAYNPDLYAKVAANVPYFAEIMNIEREKENPRKDYEKYGNLLDIIGFFYDDLYQNIIASGITFNPKFNNEQIINVLNALKDGLSIDQDEQSWFNNMKAVGQSIGFAGNNKEFKANPDAFIGTIGDMAEILRISLTGRKNSPNLYYVMKILGLEETHKRINYIISLIK